MPDKRFRITPLLAAAGVCATAAGLAAPHATAQSGYPDIADYRQVSSVEIFRTIDRPGRWFSTGIGLYCGIGDDGSYGCSGALAGGHPGDNEIGWFPGDPSARVYHTDRPTFASGAEQTPLPSKTFFRYHGSTCASTEANSVYCINGNNPDSQILVTTAMAFRGRNAQPIS